jgi:hypothetical protein
MRLLLAILVAVGISVGLTAYESSFFCEIDCGDGCKIQVEGCYECIADEENCTIYFEEPSCEFYCTAGCDICEVFEN